MARVAAGATFGRWTLIDEIGAGHSSVVWKATDQDGRIGAIKLLKAGYVADQRRYERVRNEILAMEACGDIPGVLPLWDSETPDGPTRTGDAWLVSPLSAPLSTWQGEGTLDEAVGICAALAATLANMHERMYSHRDIKPANILFWADRWHLGDFGIAAGPDLSKHTREGEKLGPTYYIAPEMLNQAVVSDGRPADVYSLAKLLWKLASGQNFPLPGLQLRDHSALNLSAWVKDSRAHMLDALIEGATQPEPGRRPSMEDLGRSLAKWFDPVPESAGPLDLAPLKSAVANLLEPVQSEERRRGELQAQADRAIAGFVWPFRPVLGQVFDALQKAGIYEIHLEDLAGGNNHFCRESSADRDSFFEYSIVAELRSDLKRASLRGGVNVGLMNLANSTTPDIYSTALGAVGYVVELHTHDGNSWRSSSTLAWGIKEEVLLNGPDSSAAQKRFIAGLLDNLYPSVQALVKAYAEG
jgi:serine/threonine protein kinase